MKALTVLLSILISGQVVEESHWTYTNAAVLVTGAQIWRVNRAESMSEERLIQLFSEAQVAQHKEIKDRNSLVFQKGARVALKSAENDKDNRNETILMERLKTLGMRIPSKGVQFRTVSTLGTVEELAKSAQSEDEPVRQWNLLGKSELKGEGQNPPNNLIPVSDYSVLIEWGHRNAIQKIQTPLLTAASEKPGDYTYNEEAIYSRHFFKVPLKLEVRESAPDDSDADEPKLIGLADPLYLVKPRREDAGYLIYLTAAERSTGRQIIALEVPDFQYKENPKNGAIEVSAQIPASCFLKNVLAVSLRGKQNLKYLDIGDPNTPVGTKKHFSTNAEKQLMLKLAFSVPQNASLDESGQSPVDSIPQSTSLRFLLESEDEDEQDSENSYAAKLEVVPDALVPFADHPVRIYDRNCAELERSTPYLGVAPKAGAAK